MWNALKRNVFIVDFRQSEKLSVDFGGGKNKQSLFLSNTQMKAVNIGRFYENILNI